MLHIDGIGPSAPRLPRPRATALTQVVVSAAIHFVVLAIIWAQPVLTTPAVILVKPDISVRQPLDLRHVVFIARDPLVIGGGGGGGGNRQSAAIRHAQGIGSDAITLRVRTPASTVDGVITADSPLAPVVLDARPLASGTFDQVGLPVGGVSYGTSTGPGSGGGVGTGTGTGIGSGQGPGVGAGTGGGIGGGFYRPGGAVTAPRVIHEVKPTYTANALGQKIQGTIVLELVVTREGLPSRIRIVRSLDPEGLDAQAISAASEWRFEPGRLGGVPVDVLVTIMLDFSVR